MPRPMKWTVISFMPFSVCVFQGHEHSLSALSKCSPAPLPCKVVFNMHLGKMHLIKGCWDQPYPKFYILTSYYRRQKLADLLFEICPHHKNQIIFPALGSWNWKQIFEFKKTLFVCKARINWNLLGSVVCISFRPFLKWNFSFFILCPYWTVQPIIALPVELNPHFLVLHL